ncbi:hypothetical protein DIPPA_00290 [Diplonema papillatum]|nr:hypothetical protein DIPPA_00290 [Diplonema papillatum]
MDLHEFAGLTMPPVNLSFLSSATRAGCADAASNASDLSSAGGMSSSSCSSSSCSSGGGGGGWASPGTPRISPSTSPSVSPQMAPACGQMLLTPPRPLRARIPLRARRFPQECPALAVDTTTTTTVDAPAEDVLRPARRGRSGPRGHACPAGEPQPQAEVRFRWHVQKELAKRRAAARVNAAAAATATAAAAASSAAQLRQQQQPAAAAAGAGDGAPAQRRLPFPLCYTMSFSTRTFMDDFDGSSCAVQ